MEIWKNMHDVPQGCRAVVTIGIFDGVHRGHRQILKRVVNEAHTRHLRSVALTFDPHPLTLHRPEEHIELIMPLEDRLNAMAAVGLDATWVEEYNWDLAALTPEEFIRRYFVNSLGAEMVVVGEDVRFGKNNSGNLEVLRNLGRKYGFAVEAITDIRATDGGRRFSSTWVRELVRAGDVAQARHVLGHPYRLRGTVVHGFQRGRSLGFPTANLDATQVGVVPADGVYAGWLVADVDGTDAVMHLPAAISVGTNPQFSGVSRTVEAHVLGRADLNLYDANVAIDFIEHLRPMRRLSSVEELQKQMDADLLHTADVLGVPPATRVNPEDVTAH